MFKYFRVKLLDGSDFCIAVNGIDFQICSSCYKVGGISSLDCRGMRKPEVLNSRYILDVLYEGLIFNSGYRDDIASGISKFMVGLAALLSKSKLGFSHFNLIDDNDFKSKVSKISKKEYLQYFNSCGDKK